MTESALVSVIDDDESIRESIPDLLRAFGFSAQAFPSAETFLAANALHTTRCVILDVAMPGMSGPDLFEHIKRQQSPVPVIFITAHGNGDLCARLMQQGAAACLFKPFEPIELVEALRAALPGN